jgi:sulfate/thiosulfate transport system permease protein
VSRRSSLPGFAPALGYTVVYLSLIVLIPLAALAVKSAELSPGELWALASCGRWRPAIGRWHRTG